MKISTQAANLHKPNSSKNPSARIADAVPAQAAFPVNLTIDAAAGLRISVQAAVTRHGQFHLFQNRMQAFFSTSCRPVLQKKQLLPLLKFADEFRQLPSWKVIPEEQYRKIQAPVFHEAKLWSELQNMKIV